MLNRSVFICIITALLCVSGCTQQPSVEQPTAQQQVEQPKPDYTDIDLLLKDDDAGIRGQGVDKLNGITHDSVKSKYTGLFTDPDPSVRLKVAWGTSRFKAYYEAEMDRMTFSHDITEKEVAYIFNLLTIDKEEQLNFAKDIFSHPEFSNEAKNFTAVTLINNFQKEPEKLIPLLKEDISFIDTNFQKFIRKLDKTKILPELKKLAHNDEAPVVQFKAIKLLTQIGDQHELNEFIPLAFAEDPKMKTQFLQLLDKYGYNDKNLLLILRHYLQDDKVYNRKKAVKLMDQIIKKAPPADAEPIEIPAKYKIILETQSTE